MTTDYDWHEERKRRKEQAKQRARDSVKRSYRRNLNHNREIARKRYHTDKAQLQTRAYAVLGAQCVRDDCYIAEHLILDHIIPLMGRPREDARTIWRKIIAGDKGFQLLCTAHNKEKTLTEITGRPRTSTPLPPRAKKMDPYHCHDPRQKGFSF